LLPTEGHLSELSLSLGVGIQLLLTSFPTLDTSIEFFSELSQKSKVKFFSVCVVITLPLVSLALPFSSSHGFALTPIISLRSAGFVGVGSVGSSPELEEQEVNENDNENENKNNNVVYLILVYCLKNSSVRVL